MDLPQSLAFVRDSIMKTAVIFWITFFSFLPSCAFPQVDIARLEQLATPRPPEKDLEILIRASKTPIPLTNPNWVVGLIKNSSIRTELGIGPKKYLEYSRITHESLSERVKVSEDRHKATDPVTRELLSAKDQEIVYTESERLNELLTEGQKNRLEQLKWFVEIARSGLANALAYGQLGTAIGVYENQKFDLFEQVSMIVENDDQRIKELIRSRHESVLRELSETQQQDFLRLFGPFFFFDEPYAVGFFQKHRDRQQMEALPESKDSYKVELERHGFESFEFYEDQQLFRRLVFSSVRKELGITADQWTNLLLLKQRLFEELSRKLVEEAKKGTNANEIEAMFSAHSTRLEADRFVGVDEVLLPTQVSRLKQVEGYIEIACVGYANAFCSGKTGKSLGIGEKQAKQLRWKVEKVEADADRAIEEIRVKGFNAALDLLTTEQQTRAADLLGPYFEYVDQSILSMKRRQKELEDQLGPK